MKARRNTILLIIGLAAVCGCASVAILAIDLYHRFSERAYNTRDADERDALLDQTSKILDKAARLGDDVQKTSRKPKPN